MQTCENKPNGGEEATQVELEEQQANEEDYETNEEDSRPIKHLKAVSLPALPLTMLATRFFQGKGAQ